MPRPARGSDRGVPALALTAAVAVLAGCGAPTCKNSIIHRVPSPDGQSDAVVFQRDCGGREGASSGVAVIPHDADLPDMPTTVLSLAQPVDVAASWSSASELRLAFPRSAQVVGKMASSPEGVSVRLEPR